jgi:hypothetical protein
MFVLTALVYPVVLGVLCVGSGLLVNRCSGGFLPAALLPAVGAAALIGVSQLTTYIAPVAPATPYVMAAFAAGGFALGRARVRGFLRRSQERPWQLLVTALAYVLALAPVLFSGRPTFSSYMALTDSAVHMIGADYLISHGQDYSHLDLRNSYGQFINAYYNTSYPSGADTLFGGSALLVRLPLIWAYQPFNAFMLAAAAGPAWLLVRRTGLEGGWAALATLGVTVPALVYAFELIGSVKEIAAVPMILTLGVLVVLHRRWLRGPPAAAIPFALVAAGGVSALGVGFGAWVLAAALVLLAVVIGDLAAARQSARRLLALIGAGALTALIAAWPTWIDLSGSLRVSQNVATTTNSGNLLRPIRPVQALGTWLWASYKLLPSGRDRNLTYLLIAIALAACVVGAVYIVRRRQYALAGWLGVMVVVWLAFDAYSTAWVGAKALMLTSPAVLVAAWAGVAALRSSALRPAAPLLALALAGGVLVSDAMQYHSSNLAPTGRYEELASLNARFAGRGPTLFTDFDEYALYQLRDMDVGGPNFIYPPTQLMDAVEGSAGGLDPSHGAVVALDRVPSAELRAYPLIVTRRDPTATRPPSAYVLIWQGTYYQLWERRAGAPAPIARLGLSSASSSDCSRLERLAQIAGSRGAHLVAASPPDLVSISIRRTQHPPSWKDRRIGLVMQGPGRLSSEFAVTHAGVWNLWLKGQIMRPVRVSVDGHPRGSLGSQLGGNSLNPDVMSPLTLALSAGRHRLTIIRGGFNLAPGNGGWAILDGIFLTPGGSGARDPLQSVSAADWPSLCGQRYDWIEAVPHVASSLAAAARQSIGPRT